jgi:hypothetical protein
VRFPGEQDSDEAANRVETAKITANARIGRRIVMIAEDRQQVVSRIVMAISEVCSNKTL